LDDTYQIYLNRVARLTLRDSYLSGLQHIQGSPKYQIQPDGSPQPVPFPGYSVISPPAESDTLNADFYRHLNQCQEQLLSLLGPDLMVPVPPESFHFTLADLIWESAYQQARQNPDFDAQLRSCIAASFGQCASLATGTPLSFEILGVMVRTRSVGVCLLPSDEDSYERLVAFRRSIYQNPDLMALGIEQQYHLIAHITLGYFAPVSPELDREALSAALFDFNQRWLENTQKLTVAQAQLRQFEDMTKYNRQPDWPVFTF